MDKSPVGKFRVKINNPQGVSHKIGLLEVSRELTRELHPA
jgi:hypothetical protein